MKYKVSCLIIILCTLNCFAQDSIQSEEIDEDEVNIKLGIVPTSLMGFTPFIHFSADIEVLDYAQLTFDFGGMHSRKKGLGYDKYVLRPLLKYFPKNDVFFIGGGFHYQHNRYLLERWMLRNEGEFRQIVDVDKKLNFLGIIGLMGHIFDFQKNYFLKLESGLLLEDGTFVSKLIQILKEF